MRSLLLAAVAALVALGATVVLGGAAPEAPQLPRRTDSPVFTTLDVATYEIEGGSEEALLHGLRTLGPKAGGAEFFGLTETQMTYRYWKATTRGGMCRLDQIHLDLNVTITLPRWQARGVMPPGLQHAWGAFDRSLRHHEDGHREIAEWSANEAYHKLRGLRAASCDEIDILANQIMQDARALGEMRQQTYDLRTGHGRTQGAVWPQPR